MSVGRFQLALRALDLRAAPCPRGLLRPTGSVEKGHFVAFNPALVLWPVVPSSFSASVNWKLLLRDETLFASDPS